MAMKNVIKKKIEEQDKTLNLPKVSSFFSSECKSSNFDGFRTFERSQKACLLEYNKDISETFTSKILAIICAPKTISNHL